MNITVTHQKFHCYAENPWAFRTTLTGCMDRVGILAYGLTVTIQQTSIPPLHYRSTGRLVLSRLRYLILEDLI